MKDNCLKKNNMGLFLVLAAFFFVRTALLAPVHCFLMKSDYPYFNFSVGGVVYIIFAIVLSLLSAKLAFVFRDRLGEIAALIYIVGVSDPLFFGTKSDAFKLLVDIIIELLILNAISEKRIVATGVAVPAALFISSFLVPFSILGYAPAVLSIYTLASRKSKKESKYVKVVLAAVACAAAGFLLNKILMSEVQVFNEWFTSFTFADVTQTTKRLRLVAALSPAAVFGTLFFYRYKKAIGASVKKKSERRGNFETVLDAFFLPAAISVVSMIFVGAESFCAINTIVPATILTLIYLKDESCIKVLNELVCYVKKYKILSFVIFVAVFALALEGAEDYFPLKQVIFYIVY